MVDVDELPEQLNFVIHQDQNGLCNHHNEEEGRQDTDNPEGSPLWASETANVNWNARDTAGD